MPVQSVFTIEVRSMFIRHLLTIAILLVPFGGRLAAQPVPPSSGDAVVSILESGRSGVTIGIDGLHPVADDAAGGSAIAGLMHNARLHLSKLDTNTLPELRFTVGVPAGATNLHAELIGAESRRMPLRLSPAPSANGFPRVEVRRGAEMRGIHTVVIAYRPFNYSGGILEYDAAARIRVTWDAPVASLSSAAKEYREIPAIEEGLRGTILNFEQASSWRRTKNAAGAQLASANASGWGIGEAALVLSVPETGVYRLTGAEFSSAAGTGAVAIADLRLHNRGLPVPFFITDRGTPDQFDAQDVLEFRGDRNPGEPGIHLNEITDTNAYILTWSGGAGDPPIPATDGRPTFNSIAEAYDSTLHFEQEEYWFGGIKLYDGDERALFITERVQQERFYWSPVAKTQFEPLTFDCSPHFEQGARITLIARIAGGVYKPVELGGGTVIQRLRTIVNGIVLSDTITLQDTNDVAASVSFPAQYLINGENRVSFEVISVEESGVGTTFTSDNRVDYLELRGRWKPYSNGGALVLPSVGGTNVGLAVAGMKEAPERALTADASMPVDSVESGHLYRLTSRNEVTGNFFVRNTPGFHAVVGDEQVATPVIGTHNFGITIAEAEPGSGGGRVARMEHFRMNGISSTERDANFAAAVNFLKDVRPGNVVLAGLAYGTTVNSMPESFIREFENLGSKAVRRENFFGAGWAFAAKKGDVSTAVESYSRNDNGVTLNAFIREPGGGSVWRAVVPVSGGSDGGVAVGPARTPGIRYHAKDELLAAENQADLIIITHPKFGAEAERLAAHRREHSGLTVKVVDIYRVYDEFNMGVKDPVAIRRFLQYADTNWSDPKPGFVILFGDASMDAMQRMDHSIMVDYIPSSGVPSTDHIYTVAFGDSTLFPRQLLGRIPATSEEDARAVVDKIIEYDTGPPARWNKKFVFATGGQSIMERDQLRDYVQFGLAFPLEVAPFYAETKVISRSGTTDADLRFPSTVDGQKVRDEMNGGALWLDFFGHGATTTIDLNYGFPEDFDNEHLYFVLATWSCQTGLFSFPEAALRNERFVTIPGKGSIASIGGTSFSFTNTDNSIRERLYGMIANQSDPDPTRNLGFLFMMSKYRMFEYNGFGAFDNNGVRSRNHVMTYNLLGDPSMDVAVRRTPELALPPEATLLTTDRNSPPDLGDSVVIVRTELWNHGGPLRGIPFDSGVVVTATLLNELGEAIVSADTVKRLGRYQTLEFRLPLDEEPGEYVVRVVADPEETVAESYRGDNVVTLTFLLRGAQPLPLEPLAYATLPGYEDITIRLLNPQSGPGAAFELDTVPTFDSQGKITSASSGTVTETELVTLWNFTIPPGIRSAPTFWWKATSTSADPGSAEKFPLIESFTVKPEGIAEAVTISGQRQMAETRLIDLVNRPDGVGPGTRSIPIEIIAMGQTFKDTIPGSELLSDKPLTVRIDGKDLRVDPRSGINVIVLPPNDVTPVADSAFVFYDINVEPGLDEFEHFVGNVIQSGHKVLLGSSGASFQVDARYDNGRERVMQAIRSLGGSIDTSAGGEDTYLLIGGKGVPPNEVKEAWTRALPLRRADEKPPFYDTLYDVISAIPKAGTWGSPVFGPAVAWRAATFDLDPASGQPLSVAVIGIRRDGLRDTVVRTSVTPGAPVADLSGIDLLKYPRLELSGGFVNDTIQRLRSVSVDFDPSPELAFVPSTLRMTPDSVLQGDPVTVEATVANLTSWRAATNIHTSIVSAGEAAGTTADSVTIGSIPALDSARITLRINTHRIRSDRPFVLLANPADVPSEPYIHNNRIAPPTLRVTGDKVPPGFAVYADDRRLMNGDYVAPAPVFEVRMYDNSLLDLDSISTITLVLDNQWIDTAGDFQVLTKGDLRALFRYTPPVPLEEGSHDLLVFVKDASGNGDTSEIITFYVERDLGLRQAVNWPNPFARETTFTFTVTGETPPESGEIAIFTASGRKIRTIRLGPGDLGVGFNKVEWDGLDEDRDRLANGVYFYRLKVRAGDRTTEIVEKLAVLR